MTEPGPSRAQTPRRWSDPLKVSSVWMPAVALVAILIVVMTLVYFGSVVNPTGHLRGLPVAVVNQDVGAPAGGSRVDFGQELAAGLIGSRAVSSRLAVRASTLAAAKDQMDVGNEYTAVVIPAGFSASLLALAGVGRSDSRPTVELLTNPRAGTLAVSLATGVLQPALSHASTQIGRTLRSLSSTHRTSAAAGAILADPLSVPVVPYRPLPPDSALGLSAFYISLLITFCGFLGAIIVGTSIDAVLGYASTEIGPVWRQRQPVTISRWQTLLAKWVLAVGVTLVLTGLMLFIAVVVLRMNAPHFVSLWLLSWFAATVVAIGTLVLLAALGTVGQLVAMLVFVYLALASSGGTVPLDALSGFFRFLANFEPLRQILDGVRAILYFDARGDAGLTRAWVASGIGLSFWVALGILVTTWYDRKELYRMPPNLMEHIDRAVLAYRQEIEQTSIDRPGPDSESASPVEDARTRPSSA